MAQSIRYGALAVPAVLALAVLLAGCGDREGGPAPLVTGGGDLPAVAPPPAYEPPPRAVPAPAARSVAPGAAERITVGRGESLSRIAHAHHVPERVLIEANHLQPPYKVLAGSTLLIPGGLGAAEPAPPVAAAARPAHGPAAEVAADVAAAAPPPQAHSVPGHKPVPPRIVMTPTGKPPEKPAPAASERVAQKTAPAPAHSGAGFLWPVHGRVLQAYGTGADGTHNDGINIAAPKGAPVEAADAGVVAYAGNELRGYGNLVLIKHAGGWITAYAHCEEILVKRGEKVARGQTIARVGATGSVKEPQLHFELRRGDHPVDPRGLLAPASTAAAGKPPAG